MWRHLVSLVDAEETTPLPNPVDFSHARNGATGGSGVSVRPPAALAQKRDNVFAICPANVLDQTGKCLLVGKPVGRIGTNGQHAPKHATVGSILDHVNANSKPRQA